MKYFEFIASYGNEKKVVKITQPTGGGDCYQILIQNYFQGVITKLKNEWVPHLNSRSELTGDDVFILTEVIEKNFLY